MRPPPDPRRPLAWSSDPPPPTPASAPPPAAVPARGAPPVRVRLERQGRGGKVVTVVEGLPGHPDALRDRARLLKTACGAGGTLKGRLLEIQGDHRTRIVALLTEAGLVAKSS